MPASTTVTIGTRFRYVVADANVLWEVTGKAGGRAWLAVAVNEPYEIGGKTFDSDFAGEERSFTTAQIQRSLAVTGVFADLNARSDRFWDLQEIGTVLHYHNSFGQYVRGVVSPDASGKKGLEPIALVGPLWDPAAGSPVGWHLRDLVVRYPDGRVNYGYHAKAVLGIDQDDSRIWRPSDTTVYESPNFSGPLGPAADVDPRKMDPISLELPEPTDEEKRVAALWQVRNAAKAALDERDVEAALAAAARILDEAGVRP